MIGDCCNKAGWWFSPTPLKNDGLKVSWDDEIPNIWKTNIFFKPTTRKCFFLALAKQQTWGLNQDFVGCVVDLG